MRAFALALVLIPAIAIADPSTTLRDANGAASSNDWARVQQLVGPLLAGQMSRTDEAEAHRLAGLAAFFTNRYDEADAQFLAYMKLELDGQLDPVVYPPEVIAFFVNVRQRHDAELRALRPKPKGSIFLSLLPPAGQFQNHQPTKGIVVGSLLGAFLTTQIVTYAVLSKWCTVDAGPSGSKATCDDSGNHASTANNLRTVNLLAGVGFVATYLYGVYDGVSTYRKRRREMSMMPYMTTSPTSSTIGLSLSW